MLFKIGVGKGYGYRRSLFGSSDSCFNNLFLGEECNYIIDFF